MAKLSAKEQKALEALQAKAEAPDAPAINRSANISMSYEQAEKLGILDDLLGSEEEPEEEEDTDDKPPVRKGFFGEQAS